MIAARNRADLQILIVLGTRFISSIATDGSTKPPLATVAQWKREAEEALLNFDHMGEVDPGTVRAEHRKDAQSLRWLIGMLGG